MKLFNQSITQYIFLLLVSTLSTCSLLAQENNLKSKSNLEYSFPHVAPAEVGVSSNGLQLLDQEINSWVESGQLIGGELLIIKDKKTIYHKVHGWADREAKRPLKLNAIWSIKSMTKPFTASAIMLLAEHGKLSLSDKVTNYLPKFAGDSSTTIAHLLSHTSGYSGTTVDNIPPNIKTLEDHVLDWSTSDPNATFKQYNYSDLGFAICGYIIQEVSGQALEEYIRTNFIVPLNMHNTSTNVVETAEWRARISAWYEWEKQAFKYKLTYTTNRKPWPFFSGAFGMYSTATDYAKFMYSFLNEGEWNTKRILDSTSIRSMITPHAFINKSPVYGYGWYVTTNGNETFPPRQFGHGGADGTNAFCFPAENIIVIWMTHSRGKDHRKALLDRLQFYGIIDTPPFEDMKRASTVNQSFTREKETVDYTGTYSSIIDSNLLFEINEENGQYSFLSYQIGQSIGVKRNLMSLGAHSFMPGLNYENVDQWLEQNVIVKFIVNKGQVDSMQVMYNGQIEFLGKKTETESILKEIEIIQSRHDIDDLVRQELHSKGIEETRIFYNELLESKSDSIRWDEKLLNALGYRLLNEDRYEEAIAVFHMNLSAYPTSPNAYDSYGDGLDWAGNPKAAIVQYKKAIQMAKEQNDSRAINFENKLKRKEAFLKKSYNH
jgi:CubicO group peptidase (beta-lactamase class C family)